MMSLQALVGLLYIVLHILATAMFAEGSVPITCHDFFFKIPTVSFNDTGVIQPAATYNISATYCPPTKFVLHRVTTVQILLHGGTSNKLYWSALAPVGSVNQYQHLNYSYVDFARGEGYHTIAIDRLGAGNSSHPDPVLVQAGLEAELTNTMIKQIRQKLPRPRLPRFKKLILVGHSYGSFIISIMLDKYPNAVDATIMTSFVHVFSNAVSAVGQVQRGPARTLFPTKFGNLNSGYVTLSNETNERLQYYSADGSFDPQVAAIEFSREDVQAIGELNSITSVVSGSYSVDKSLYAGPLAIMLGQEDQPFCHGDCGKGNSSFISLSRQFWPSASRYTGFLLKDTGHYWMFHYSAKKGMELVHDWLATSGF